MGTVGGPVCIKMVTGTTGRNDKGNVDVHVDNGQGYVRVEPGDDVPRGAASYGLTLPWYADGVTVLDACYSNLQGVRVTNRATNGWIGSVAFARTKAGPYVPGTCASCNVTKNVNLLDTYVGGETARLLVDGSCGGEGVTGTKQAECDEIIAVLMGAPTGCLQGNLCGIDVPWHQLPPVQAAAHLQGHGAYVLAARGLDACPVGMITALESECITGNRHLAPAFSSPGRTLQVTQWWQCALPPRRFPCGRLRWRLHAGVPCTGGVRA